MILDHDTPTMSETDFERLSYLQMKCLDSEKHAPLAKSLRTARILPNHRFPSTIVTMNSVVAIEDQATRRIREIVLVYPFSANLKTGKVPVDSTLGTKLLGAQVGQTIEVKSAEGAMESYKILSILYQPEAMGERI